jgi:hypothetical protein
MLKLVNIFCSAGEKIPGLGRISGLDPAEPYFQNMPEFTRLDPSDATLVDTIHTDSRSILLLGYGMSQPCGHLDFYPNDGFQQPGCEVTQVPLNLIQAKDLNPLELAQREVIACNHNRAIYYFLESIKSKCQYVGHARDSRYFCRNAKTRFIIDSIFSRTILSFFYLRVRGIPSYACTNYREYLKV